MPFLGCCLATAANAGPIIGWTRPPGGPSGAAIPLILGTTAPATTAAAFVWFLLGVELIKPGLLLDVLLVLLLLLTAMLPAVGADIVLMSTLFGRIAIGFTGVIFTSFGRLSLLLSTATIDASLLWLSIVDALQFITGDCDGLVPEIKLLGDPAVSLLLLLSVPPGPMPADISTSSIPMMSS